MFLVFLQALAWKHLQTVHTLFVPTYYLLLLVENGGGIYGGRQIYFRLITGELRSVRFHSVFKNSDSHNVHKELNALI